MRDDTKFYQQYKVQRQDLPTAMLDMPIRQGQYRQQVGLGIGMARGQMGSKVQRDLSLQVSKEHTE